MNTKILVGALAAIVILVAAFFAFHKSATAPAPVSSAPVPAATTTAPVAATSSPAATTTAAKPATPSFTVISQKAVHVAAFDQSSLTASSPRPVITGTANVPSVAIVLDNPSGVGIAGSSRIAVTNGRWSFTAPQRLSAGIYTLHLLGGDQEVVAKLTITE